jgi:hypothetical protein
MATFRCNGEADKFISDLYGAPVLKAYFFVLKRINRLSRLYSPCLYLSRHHDASRDSVKMCEPLFRWMTTWPNS